MQLPNHQWLHVLLHHSYYYHLICCRWRQYQRWWCCEWSLLKSWLTDVQGVAFSLWILHARSGRGPKWQAWLSHLSLLNSYSHPLWLSWLMWRWSLGRILVSQRRQQHQANSKACDYIRVCCCCCSVCQRTCSYPRFEHDIGSPLLLQCSADFQQKWKKGSRQL